MKYVIDKLADLEIIKVTVSGTLNQDIRKEFHPKIVSELNKNGYYRLLIDVTGAELSPDYMTGNPDELANYMNRTKPNNHTQIAFLNKQVAAIHGSFVKLAHLADRRYIKYFRDYDKAVTWLLGGEDIFT